MFCPNYVWLGDNGGNVMSVLFAGHSLSESVFEDFSSDATSRWDFVADAVMGGVSSGRIEVVGTGAMTALRLHGRVSTENNGGFIQARRRFSDSWPREALGLRLRVKGNGARYFVFLKTPNLSRIWHSFRAPFVAKTNWHDVEIPFHMFSPSHMGMPAMLAAPDVNSIAIVAYGDDFDADISVRDIRLY